MEVIYLANQDENIHFALIGDFKDGPEEHNESDEAIIETGSRLIKELNQRYGRSDIFYFSIGIVSGMLINAPGWAGSEKRSSDRI